MLSFFKCITRSSSLSLEEIKLIAIVNLLFHALDFFEIIYDVFQVWSEFIDIFFN